ncbi:endolytic transglycosylase MltG [Roseiarcaceae bacterium H3SJ34-1]|uniref:endolytic transglycosylase MltG n=1 Tax=Terripilifer ovatus TaxID=3032367 RepID=UPI003AB986F8|nr:endolytic transglycosylase MltG [Roseiarcaceae bacterium H3SJ34-1]
MSEGQPTEGEGVLKPVERERARFFGRRRSLQTPTEALQPEAAPPPPAGKPPSQRRPILSGVSGFLSFLLLAALLAVGSMASLSKRLNAPGPLAVEQTVYIPPRTDVMEIIDQLDKTGVINEPTLMRIALIAEQKWRDVKAGEYLFKQKASLQDVIDTLVAGKQILHSVTIPEGLTSEQIVQRLRDNDLLAGEVREIPREGTIMPETYRVARGMARTALIAQMQAGQNRLLDQIWERRAPDLPLKSKYELVTLASIVEKETGRADERTRVAAVFQNRLQKRMRLQSDPTIVYGIVGGKGTLGRPIQRTEITRPTPYNTYVIDGLPPGPIANPGRAAMEAVANPSKTRDLYFVANGTGGHAFAETVDQHNRNVLRWRDIEKEMKAKAAAGAADAPPPDVDRISPDDPIGVDVPQRTAPPRRSDLFIDPVFGGLTATASSQGMPTMESAPVVALMPNQPPQPAAAPQRRQSARAAIQQASPAPQPAAEENKAIPPAATAFAGFALGPSVDQLGFVIRGVNDRPDARQMLDGPVSDGAAASDADMTIVPLSAARRADQQARMARFGNAVDNTPLPAGDDGVAPQPEPVHATAPAPVRPKAFDASEGTKLDPLRNTTWDLNSTKTVPPFRTLQ